MRSATLVASVVAMTGMFAGSQAHSADVWTPALVPSSVQATESGGFIVYFESSFSSVCGNRVHIYQGYHSVNDSGAKAMLATALAALSSERRISVMYDDSTSYCWGRYVTINR